MESLEGFEEELLRLARHDEAARHCGEGGFGKGNSFPVAIAEHRSLVSLEMQYPVAVAGVFHACQSIVGADVEIVPGLPDRQPQAGSRVCQQESR